MGEGKKERMLTTTKASPRSFPLHQGSKSGMSIPYTVFPIAARPSSRCPGKAAPWTELVSETPGEEGRSPQRSQRPQSRALSHHRLFQKWPRGCGSSALFLHPGH